MIAQTEEIIRCRVQQRNITTVVEKLQLCLPGEWPVVKYDGKLNKVSHNSQNGKEFYFLSCGSVTYILTKKLMGF